MLRLPWLLFLLPMTAALLRPRPTSVLTAPYIRVHRTRQLFAQLDWTPRVDEVSGATYYYNEQTGESQWEPPQAGMAQPAYSGQAASYGTNEVLWRFNGRRLCSGGRYSLRSSIVKAAAHVTPHAALEARSVALGVTLWAREERPRRMAAGEILRRRPGAYPMSPMSSPLTIQAQERRAGAESVQYAEAEADGFPQTVHGVVPCRWLRHSDLSRQGCDAMARPRGSVVRGDVESKPREARPVPPKRLIGRGCPRSVGVIWRRQPPRLTQVVDAADGRFGRTHRGRCFSVTGARCKGASASC